MDWKLEVVVIPVTDVDRARQFYGDKLGFNIDVDRTMSDEFRVVQTTPSGSACSVSFGRGLNPGLQLVVSDAAAARQELADRGVEVSEVVHFEDGVQKPGPGGEWNTFFFFQDPDGNDWTVQEKPM
jgi:catechol 2,3-dioxygenase-like lactoylglutathione lyase family enzyme